MLVLQFHLKDIFGLQMYTLVTLAHMWLLFVVAVVRVVAVSQLYQKLGEMWCSYNWKWFLCHHF